MLWLLFALFWLAFPLLYALWLRPRVAHVRARLALEDREIRAIPVRKQRRTVAVCLVGSAVAMGVMVIVGLDALGALLASIAVAVLVIGVTSLTLRDVEQAQAE